ncbi:hypothetical protein QTP86_013987 [Hemibagrus guttatus]|nr:hypothetical protein QTP86_013987 [Hemibagrus guttatus]
MSLSRCLLEPMEVREFIKQCMLAVGTKASHASSLADVLVEGDLRGHYSHGLNRMGVYENPVPLNTILCPHLDLYVKETRAGICAKEGEPVVEKESVATALVNGKNLLGPVVGNYCMGLALKKAQDVGIGWVVAYSKLQPFWHCWLLFHASTETEHDCEFGDTIGDCVFECINQLKRGMCYTNTSPLVVPTRGKECTLGTNPISVAAPAKDGDSFELDMATSAVALGKVELHARNGCSIPEGWGCDANGLASSDPKAVLSGGGLVPVGGSETTGGYKGYGLALMVEVFCGILAGSNYSKHIRTWRMTDRRANLGQCFVALNPEFFADGFNDRMSDLLSLHRNLEPAEPQRPVLVPGDPERKHNQTCRELDGIPYSLSVVKHMQKVMDWIRKHTGYLILTRLPALWECLFCCRPTDSSSKMAAQVVLQLNP